MTDNRKIDWATVASKIAEKYDGIDHGDYYLIRCPCSGHEDRNPSCKITVTDSALLARCYVCDAVDSGHAYQALFAAGDLPYTPTYIKTWERSKSGPIFFDSYLEARGLPEIDMPDAVRVNDELWHSGTQTEHVGIVCAVTDVNENLIAIHKTYLNDEQDGVLDVPDKKKFSNKCGGGHVKLRKGSKILHIGEGLETTLAVMSHLPETCSKDAVWATLSASNLSGVQIPTSDYKTVHIWADKDRSSAGEKSARALAMRLMGVGLTCFIHLPTSRIPADKKSVDWLDAQSDIENSHFAERVFAATEWERDGAVFPDGIYLSEEDGVVLTVPGKKDDEPKNIRLSYYPVWVECKCPQIDSHGSWVGIRYWSPTHKRYMSLHVSREAFSSRAKFQSNILAATGISVDGKYQDALCDYLRRCNDLTPVVRPLNNKLGYVEHDGEFHYVPYSEKVKLITVDGIKKRLVNAFTAQSNCKDWITNVLEPSTRTYGGAFVFGAALAAPLVKLLKTMPFSVCLTALSDGGKSLAVSCALSMWGDPQRFAIDAGSSQVGVNRGLDFLNDMPFLIEEAQLCDPADMTRLVYRVGNKTTRLKGTKEADGLRDDADISGILFMPAEAKIAERLAYDGAQRRVVIFEDDPLPELSDDEKERLSEAVTSNYGHIAPKLVDLMIEAHSSGELRPIFESCKSLLTVRAQFQKRQKPRYATMLVGVEIFRKIVGDVYADRIKAAVLRHWEESGVKRPQTFVGMRALQALLDYKSAHPLEFNGADSIGAHTISGEMQDDGCFAVNRTRLREILGKDFDVSNVVEEWRKLEWLRLTPGEARRKATRTRARIGTEPRAWALVLNTKALEAFESLDN